MNSENLKFISYNVKGIQKSEKIIKIFEYLKKKYDSQWIHFSSGNT